MKIAYLQPFYITQFYNFGWFLRERHGLMPIPISLTIQILLEIDFLMFLMFLKDFTLMKISKQIHNIYIIVGCWMGLGLAVGLYVFVLINSFTWYR